jgi:ACS family tartrate transporter-like MFS transporter
MVGIGLAVLATNATYGPYWAMPTAILPRALAATGIALINSVGNTGGFFGPYLIGLLKTSSGGFKGGLLLAALGLLITGMVTLVLPLKRRAAAAAQ